MKKEYHLAQLRTVCVAALVWVALSAPVWAQSAVEKVLQSIVKDFAATGVTVKQGSKSFSEGAVEWRNVMLSMPRVTGQLKLGFVRVVEQPDSTFVIEYPRMMTGRFAPVAGLSPLNLVTTGAVSHSVSSAKRGAVHKISTDSVSGVLSGTNPTSYTTLNPADFALEHTADRGVPLRLDRIRDWLFSGVLEIDVKGGFAVLDKLVALGEVSTFQANVVRTMVGGGSRFKAPMAMIIYACVWMCAKTALFWSTVTRSERIAICGKV